MEPLVLHQRRGPPPLPLASAAAAAPGATDAGTFQWGVAKAIAEARTSLRCHQEQHHQESTNLTRLHPGEAKTKLSQQLLASAC